MSIFPGVFVPWKQLLFPKVLAQIVRQLPPPFIVHVSIYISLLHPFFLLVSINVPSVNTFDKVSLKVFCVGDIPGNESLYIEILDITLPHSTARSDHPRCPKGLISKSQRLWDYDPFKVELFWK